MSQPTAFETFGRPLRFYLPARIFAAVLRGALLAAILFFPALMPEGLGAQDVEGFLNNLTRDDDQLPWTIEADTLQYDQKTERYSAAGRVVIEKGGRVISADRVWFDRRDMTALAEGHVRVASGGDTLTGSRVEIDLEKETGTVADGYLYLRENNFHIKGREIRKTGPNTYEIDQADVTTCDGANPDWNITGRKVRVTVEGYGIVRDATLRAAGVPVLYSPFLFFPAKAERQTGLLFPELGTSNRWGNYINQPFFWAISDSADATFYDHYMAERGNKMGGEFRYFASETTKGAWMFDYLDDRKVDDGTEEASKKWGYADDDVLRPNHDRYWFRGGHYFRAPLGMRARLELDVVSDQDYLDEFKEGHSGYDETAAYFLNAFGRELDDYTDPARLNRFNLARTWEKFNLDVDFQWTDDVIARRFADTDPTLQRMPVIVFSGLKQQIYSSSLYFDLDSSYNNFYREDGETGHRVDAYPRFYWPLRIGGYFSIEPSIGLRETLWWVDPEGEGDSGDKLVGRQLWDGRLELNSLIFKVFDVKAGRIDRIRHTIKPAVTYEYIPKVGQSDLPAFDTLDRIGPANRITYAVTNYFTTRELRKSPPQGGAEPPLQYDYAELCRFKLEQSYDIEETRDETTPIDSKRRPFSPIGAELDVLFSPYVNLISDARWNVYDGRFEEGNLALGLSDSRRDTLTTEYRYTREEIHSVYTDLLVNWNDAVATGLDYERNLRTGEQLRTGVRLLYRAACWSVQIRYVEEPSDQKIEFAVNLFGLGEIGSR